MKVALLTIGDEILIGQIVDTNSAWLGNELNKIGAEVEEIRSVADTQSGIFDAVSNLMETHDVVLCTGGLGPTKDDITKKVLAEYFNSELHLHTPTLERIREIFKKFNKEISEAHHAQCHMPDAAKILTNKMGTAPGMWFEKGDKVLVSMPGVPHEMKYLMEAEVLPRLVERPDVEQIVHKTILTIGEGESTLADKLEKVINDFPENIKVAFLPGIGQVRVRLTAKGNSKSELEDLLEEKTLLVKNEIGQYIYGYGKMTLPEYIGEFLAENEMTLSIAESCTGGYLSQLITSIPGSSRYYQGSVIAYANEIKEAILSVNPDAIKKHGAVSEEVVSEMQKGVLNLYKTNLSIATSGIMGPSGGSKEKPVGTVYIADGNQERVKVRKLNLFKNRALNIQYTATKALELLRNFLIE
jgi:nicotinamide-nucleotide amidase